MAKLADVKIGDKFSMLTVVEEVERWVYPSGETRRQFLMQCDCGNTPKKLLISNFKTGSTKSCGCFNIAKNTTHGMHNARQYQCWADMKTRCDCKDNKFYDYYGGRGISYCDKWKTFEGFWEDMEEGYSDNLTINRRDNDGNYCKDNCSWDTKTFQGHMRRKLRDTLFSVIGASESSTGRINAGIKFEIYNLHLGAYDTEEEVAEAYDLAAEWLYGDRPNKTVSTRPEIAVRVKRYYDNRDVIMQAKGSENWNATLTDQEALEIWDLLKSKQFLQRELAILYDVKPAVISSISKGMSWVHITGAPRVFREKMPFNVYNIIRFTNGPHAYWGVGRAVKGKRVLRRNFSVTKLGEDGAKEAAANERIKWIEEIRLEEAV